ncbi:MAG: FHA domain-containing protein [Acidimicrobiia bacterium]
MPALFLTLLKLIFIALLYLVLWQVARSVASHTGVFSGGLGRRRRGTSVLVVRSDTQTGMTFDVRDAVVVGRSDSADVQIEDAYASEFHLRLVAQDGGLILHDLGSTNGTYVNGRRISTPITLARGDAVQVGKTILEVR